MNPQMIVDVGEIVATLLWWPTAPRLTRSIPTGSNSIIKAAVQNLNIDEQQAKQFVSKFGLSKDRLEGQVFNRCYHNCRYLNGEIDKSIKFSLIDIK